ncbi:hypothetical protein [Streptomyces sp. NPDC018833]|uniref:hypothetical protein n=1 Tax=Streptomyces sp. NPDC018833 TaxID=3365053 RepID=UPI0037A19121
MSPHLLQVPDVPSTVPSASLAEARARTNPAAITGIAKVLGVSPGTLYNHIPDL